MYDEYERTPPAQYSGGRYPQQPAEGYSYPPRHQGYDQPPSNSGPYDGDPMNSGQKVLVIAIISMCIIIPIAIGFYLAGTGSSGGDNDNDGGGDGFDDYYDDGEDGRVRILSISGSIEVDNPASTVNLSLTHNGGDPIYWNEYSVTVSGAAMVGYPTNTATGAMVSTSSVGETVMWTISNAAGSFVVGSQYTVKVIYIEDSSIAWQKDITANSA